MWGAPARMVSDKSIRFQVGWTKPAPKETTGNDVTAQRQSRVPVVSNRGSCQIDATRGEIRMGCGAGTEELAACPHKLEPTTAVCVYADGVARPSSLTVADRTARAREWFGQRGASISEMEPSGEGSINGRARRDMTSP